MINSFKLASGDDQREYLQLIIAVNFNQTI